MNLFKIKKGQLNNQILKSVFNDLFFTIDDIMTGFYNLLFIPIFLVRIEENLFKT